MNRVRQPGHIIRVTDPSDVHSAFASSNRCAGVLVRVPMPDCVKTQLTALPAAIAHQFRHSLGERTDTLPALHSVFGNVAAYMRDVGGIYESISAVAVSARASPLVYVGGGLSAPWHFDASKKPLALANPGHIHLHGSGMVLLSVEGSHDLPLNDHRDDASQIILTEDVIKLRAAPGVKATDIAMDQADLLIFTDECLHISGADPADTDLKLRASLGMFEVQAPRVATPPALLQSASFTHQSRRLG